MTHDLRPDRAAVPDVRVEIFDPHHATEAAWIAFQQYRRVRDIDRNPDVEPMHDAAFVRELRHEWPLVQHHRWAVVTGASTVVGNLLASVRRPHTPGADEYAKLVETWGYVLPGWRRLGIGTRLLGTLHDFMVAHGRELARVQTYDAPAQNWLASLDAPARLVMLQNRLQLDGCDSALLQRWRDTPAVAERGLRWEVHAGRVPLERLEQLLPVFNRFLEMAPRGALEGSPDRYDMESMRSWYADMDARGGAHHVAMLADRANQVLAVSQGAWDARVPEVLSQHLTGTDPHWRGLGLAKAVKAALLLAARECHPTLRRAITFNAEVNSPMLAVNRQMGYAIYRREAFHQVSRDAVGRWLAARGAPQAQGA